MLLQYLECSWQVYWKIITILHQRYFICLYRLCIKICYRCSWKMASSKEQICGSSFGTVPFSGQLLECFQPFLPRYVFSPRCVGSLCYHCYRLCFSFFTFFFLDVECNYNKPLSHLILSRTRMLYLDSKIPANSCCFKGKQRALWCGRNAEKFSWRDLHFMKDL